MRRSRGPAVLAGVVAAALLAPAQGLAQSPLSPINDLAALGQGLGQTPDPVAIVKRAAPPLVATPRAKCGPGSKPEPGIQGRVPAGSAANGLWCNVTLLSHQGTSAASRSCATSTARGTSARSTTPRCSSRSTRSTSTA